MGPPQPRVGHCIAFRRCKHQEAGSVRQKRMGFWDKHPDVRCNRRTHRQRTSRPSGHRLPRRKFASRVRALPPPARFPVIFRRLRRICYSLRRAVPTQRTL
eukprot:gene22912-biopygen16301